MCVKRGCTNACACSWKDSWCAVTSALSDVTCSTSWIKTQAQRATWLVQGHPMGVSASFLSGASLYINKRRALDAKFPQTSSFTRFPLTQNLLSRLSVRTGPSETDTGFHDKHGDTVLGSGATFCVATWTCTATRIGIEWNLSPRKEWRGQ